MGISTINIVWAAAKKMDFFNAGYAVWREAIADIMADTVMSDYAAMTHGMAAHEIRNCYDRLCCQDSEAKKCMSLIIGYIMISKEVSRTKDWKDYRDMKTVIKNPIPKSGA